MTLNFDVTDVIAVIKGAEEEDPHAPPSYSDPGWLLVEIVGAHDDGRGGLTYEIEESAYDGSAFWINEGVGIQYWLEASVILPVGWWVIEDIKGVYLRGDWSWGEDDDEEWTHGFVRPATKVEIDTLEVVTCAIS